MNKLTILYVEDDADIRAVTELALDDGDIELVSCESGQQALEQATDCHAGLLLLDVMMPGMDGIETLTALRKVDHLKYTPAIFITAKVQAEEIARYKDLGAAGVIRKPFDPMHLLDEVLALYEKALSAVPESKRPAEKAQRKHDKYKSIRDEFIQGVPQRLEEISNSLNQLSGMAKCENVLESRAYVQVHSLAGAAASFGLQALGEQAVELETLLKSLAKNPSDESLLEDIQSGREALLDPALQKVDASPEGLDENASDLLSKTNVSERALVYVLEDDIALSEEAVEQLKLFDYDARSFNDIAAIRKACESRYPDAFLIDLCLHEGRFAGAEFAKTLNQSKHKKPVPLLFMSGNCTWEDRLQAAQAKANSFLSKPINFDELAELLDRLTGRGQVEKSRILVVDDTELLADHYVSVMRRAGFEARGLYDPRGILEALADFNPDLVLVDLYMPECNGVDVANIIRHVDAYIQIPIVFLSAETSTQVQLDALSMGGDDFLQKPIMDHHLVAAVKNRVQRFGQLNRLMVRDSLTGLLNHTHLKLALEREISLADRGKRDFCFAMIDLDNFKTINDRYGHTAGDRVIKNLVRLFSRRLRRADMAARYGGRGVCHYSS